MEYKYRQLHPCPSRCSYKQVDFSITRHFPRVFLQENRDHLKSSSLPFLPTPSLHSSTDLREGFFLPSALSSHQQRNYSYHLFGNENQQKRMEIIHDRLFLHALSCTNTSGKSI